MAVHHKRRPEENRCDTCGAERPEFYIDAPGRWELICADDAARLGVDVSSRTELLDIVRAATEARRGAETDWRAAIQQAIARGARVVAIAEAAGISRERVYQIRDGRR